MGRSSSAIAIEKAVSNSRHASLRVVGVRGRLGDRYSSRDRIASHYWVLVAAACTLLLFSYSACIRNLIDFWRANSDYSAGAVVPLVAIYLVWTRRSNIGTFPNEITAWALFGVIIAQLAGLFGIVYKYDSIERYSLVLTVAFLSVLLLGWARTLQFKWILVFLLLMVPLPNRVHNAISLPLQTFATQSAAFGLECMGYLVSREGNVLRLSDQTTIAVAEACSGLRMLTAFVIVAATLALAVKRPKWQKLILVASSIPIAILGNTLRLIATALLFEKIGGDTARRFFHDFAGITMMPVACLLLGTELWLMRGHAVSSSSTKPSSSRDRVHSCTTPTISPLILHARVMVCAVVLLTCAGAGRVFVRSKVDAAVNRMLPLTAPLSSLNVLVGDWVGRDLPLDESIIRIAADDDYLNREYQNAAQRRSVGVYVGYIGRPRARMGHRPDVCYRTHGYEQTASELLNLTMKDGSSIPAILYEFKSPELGGPREFVLATFLINGRFSNDIAEANSYNRRSAGIFSQSAAYVARVQMSMRDSGNRAADVSLLSDFAAHFVPQVYAAMPFIEP